MGRSTFNIFFPYSMSCTGVPKITNGRISYSFLSYTITGRKCAYLATEGLLPSKPFPLISYCLEPTLLCFVNSEPFHGFWCQFPRFRTGYRFQVLIMTRSKFLFKNTFSFLRPAFKGILRFSCGVGGHPL